MTTEPLYAAAFPDLCHRVSVAVEGPTALAVELRATATHTGPVRSPRREVPPTGRALALSSCDFGRDGRIATWHAYFDNVDFMTQLGLMPR